MRHPIGFHSMIRVCASPVHGAHATKTSHPQSSVTVYDMHAHHMKAVCQLHVLGVKPVITGVREAGCLDPPRIRVTHVTASRIVRCIAFTQLI